MRNREEVSIGYSPRNVQREAHKLLRRFNVLVWHRRTGKTVFSIADKVDRGLKCPFKRPQLAYISPTYAQSKRVAWEYFKDFVKPIQKFDKNLVNIHEQELRIDIQRPSLGDHVRFMLLGADNPDSLRGIYLDWATLDEYAQCDPSIWGEVIYPTLSDRRGGATFIGTPKGQNHFYDVYNFAKNQMKMHGDDSIWYTSVKRASETGILSKEELAIARSTMTDSEYRQEYECDFSAALIGSYYGKYLSELEAGGRLTNVPYQRGFSVETYWDLGLDDSTAIWFVQQAGREIHIIDYYENSGFGLEHYAKVCNEKGYVYSEHVLPHDAAAKELGTGKSREESLRGYGISGRTRILPRASVEDGIHAVRNILSKCWFDLEKTRMGFLALKNYQRQFDGKRKVYDNKPHHDWTSHAADGFRTFAMGIREKYGTLDGGQLEKFRTAAYTHNPLGF